MTVRAAGFDLLSALLDSWAVWDAVAAELGALSGQGARGPELKPARVRPSLAGWSP
ncbi:MAG TPA: hypothetical protein VLQ79_01490 [Myxococcaceae bacterium]|nr:hypothetical protein [Myxococcaceae bacterium]